VNLALLLMVLAFSASVPWGSWVVRLLLRKGIGKHIRQEEPDAHQQKSGTATMGGLYILAGIVVFSLILAAVGYAQALLPLVAMVAFGALGAYDDLQGLRDRGGVGWLARFKFTWQWVVGLAVSALLYLLTPTHALALPISGTRVELGIWYLPIAAILMVWTANAVNLTDGLDGLAGTTSVLAYLAFGALALWAGQHGTAYFCFALVGMLLAFLWYNVHPARMFMGDTGSQALGAGVAAVAMLTGQWLLLPLIGFIFTIEALSVMLQVSYFKYTRRKFGEGRRILRMSPLHYHFELGGWAEVQTALRFSLVAAVMAALGVALGVRWQ
jgi:phospho-N-acetylmuramoyl-pentapeptide-transferase